MLEQSFIHVPGLGSLTEQSLWEQGCHSWRSYLASPTSYRSNQVSQEDLVSELELSVGALEARHHQYFRHRFGTDAWRAFADFKDRCVYLDIETDGGTSGDAITTIGMWNGTDFVALIKGQNLGNFLDEISKYSMIVTFFGASFDIPMLKKKFRDWEPDQIHIDLCPTLKKVGLHGGLKKIEKQLGISRGDDTDGLTGRDAIWMWNRYYRNHDEASLERLIAYNREDVVNLETLAEYAYRQLRSSVRGTHDEVA